MSRLLCDRKETRISKNMYTSMIVYMQCGQFTSGLRRILTDSLRMTIRAMPGDAGIQIDVVPVSITAEHGETVSHIATSCDPILNLRRIATR